MGTSRTNFGSLDACLFSGFRATGRWSRRAYAAERPAHNAQAALSTQTALSAWTRSAGKRAFDITCTLCAMPLVLPLLLVAALVVRITSPGPVLYCQRRAGAHGRLFTILKFRTMLVPDEEAARTGLTTQTNQPFTPVGPFLRRWKLDELPQFLNILRGEMSLVGPRPKLPCYEAHSLPCRPGLTGAATLVFAREEQAMAHLPGTAVEPYYQAVVQPFKHKLDTEYMRQATFLSDLRLLVRSLFRAWNDVALTELPPWIPQMYRAGSAKNHTIEKPSLLKSEDVLTARSSF